MKTRTLAATLAASFALPLLALGCNRQEPLPVTTAPGIGKQATPPSSPEKAVPESLPPASATSPSSSTPPPNEPAKAN